MLYRRRTETPDQFIPPAVRHLLLTGELPKGIAGVPAAFRLMKSPDRIAAVWFPVRDVLLEKWRAQYGADAPPPWAEVQFGSGRKHDDE